MRSKSSRISRTPCRRVRAALLILFTPVAASGLIPFHATASDAEADSGGQAALLPSIAVEAERVVVGLPAEHGFSGRGYVMQRADETWIVEQELAAGDAGGLSHFGSSVAIAGDLIAVGSPWQENLTGSVELFRSDGSEWGFERSLTPEQAHPGDRFGSQVRLDGTRLIVANDPVASGQKTIYVFDLSTGTWGSNASLISEDVSQEGNRISESEMADLLQAIDAFTGGEETATSSSAAFGTRPRGEIQGSELEAPGRFLGRLLPPPAPDTVRATDDIFEDRVEIRWSSVGLDAIVYAVRRIDNDPSPPDTTFLSVTSSEDTLYVDSSGDPGVAYDYCVTVINGLDEESGATCDSGSRKLNPPTSMTASDGTFEDQIRLQWSDQSEIEAGYNIYRGAIDDTVQAFLAATEPNVDFYQDTSAVAGVSYEYCVRTFDEEAFESEAACDDGARGYILPPGSVSATDGQDPDRVLITWVDQTDLEVRHNVYRDEFLIGTVPADSTTYIDSTGVFGVVYEYCVTTETADSLESVPACDDGGRGVLPAPTVVDATDDQFDDRVELSWDDPSDTEDGFYIFRRDLDEADSTLLATTGPDETTLDDPTAERGVVYRYCVRAFSNAGGVSDPVCDLGSRSLVLAPTSVTATEGNYEDRVAISWESASTVAVLFKIYRDSSLIKTVGAMTNSYEDRFTASGVRHPYGVEAVTALGDVSARAYSDSGFREMHPPSSVDASDEEYEQQVLISWNDQSGFEEGFRIYRREVGATDSTLVGETGKNQDSYLDLTGVPAVEYIYSVAAFDSLGASRVGTDSGKRSLVAPTALEASDGDFEDRVTLTWEDNSHVEEGYEVYRRKVGASGDSVSIGTTGSNGRTFVDSTLAFGVDQEYWVVAFDDYGESASTTDTGFSAVRAPRSVRASDGYRSKVVVSWVRASEIATGYEIYRDDIFQEEINPIRSTWIDPNPGTNLRQYCVRAVTDSAASEYGCDNGSVAPVLPDCPLPSGLSSDLDERWEGNGGNDDLFGSSVAIDSSWAVVGAPGEAPPYKAYVYKKRNSGNWTFEQTLIPQFGGHDCDSGDSEIKFGAAVAIDGNWIMVGAPHLECGDNDNAGAVFVFKLNNGNWEQTDYLTREFPLPDQRFGNALALDGTRLLVGAAGVNSERGQADVFNLISNVWTHETTLSNPGGQANDNFGSDVALLGDRALIGAKGAGDGGKVFIFEKNGDWSLTETLPGGTNDDRFGYAVALEEDLAVVGAPFEDNSKGAVYIYTFDNGFWSAPDRITPETEADNAKFGSSVTVEGNVLLIGAPSIDSGPQSYAYMFQRDVDTECWVESLKLVPLPDDDGLGLSISMTDPYALIGGNSSGSAGFAYRFDPGSVDTYDTSSTPGSVDATDGTATNRVQITWEDRSEDEEAFHIYRDDDAEPLAVLDPGTTVYSDFEAKPGQVHRYAVKAFNEDRGESSAGVDYGWRPPNGSITGRVATRENAAVGGVTVCLDPVPNSAVLLDGEEGHLFVEKPAVPDTALTVEFWMRSNDPALLGYPFFYSTDLFLNAISIGNTLNLRVRILGQSTGGTGISVDDGKWHHIAATWRSSDGQVQLFLDGDEEVLMTGIATGSAIPDSGLLVLGQRWDFYEGPFDSTNAYQGQLDEVRVWNHVRTESQIEASMHIPLSGDEIGLINYWPMDEGTGTAAADGTPSNSYGVLQTGAFWTSEASPIRACASTDEEGNYVFSNVRYGTGQTFKVEPSLGAREFDPAFKRISLNTESPVQNEVAFLDISSFTVTGTIAFSENPLNETGASCPVPEVEIWADDIRLGTTDIHGEFAIPLGIGQHDIEPKLAGHTFSPTTIELQVEDNTDGVDFLDTRTVNLSGRVGGGCNRIIGDVALEFRSENNCFLTNVETNSVFSLDLPPQKYFARVVDVENIPEALDIADILRFFEDLGTRQIDLGASLADSTMDFIYRAPLQVTINGLPDPPAGCGSINVPVIEQTEPYPLTVEVFEYYGEDDTCPVDTGRVVVFDEIMDQQDEPVELIIEQGQVHYTTIGNTPNIFSGRVDSQGNDRSYQKPLTVFVEVEGKDPVTKTVWVVVTGHRPRIPTFTSTTDEVPLLILRDPPGDNSYAYIEEGTTICSDELKISQQTFGGGLYVKLKTGLVFHKGTPFFSTKTDAQTESEGKFLVGGEILNENLFRICATTTERFSTSDDELFVGTGGDVYMGLAMNLVFAKTDVVAVEDCEVVKSEDITVGGDADDSFKSTYIYTESHIRNIVIPQLKEIADSGSPDSVRYRLAARNWREQLARNVRLKEEADDDGIKTLSAGADYEYSFTSDSTHTVTHTAQIWTDNSVALGFRFGEAGTSYNSQLVLQWRGEWTKGNVQDTTKTRTVGYVLSDDDIGDYFAIQVKDDSEYGTPVFDLISGTSSCPWERWPDPETGEPRSQPRDGALLSIEPPLRSTIPPEDPAVFTLSVTNDSQSDEAREYLLRPIQTSNPGGAVLKVNGSPLGDGVAFFLDPGASQEATLTVERGPTRYRYEDMALQIVPPCELANWRNGGPLQRADTTYFTVEYDAPCSDITLFRPRSGWLSNYNDGNLIQIILDEFEFQVSETDSLVNVGAEYRLEDTEFWYPIAIVPRNQIETWPDGSPKSVSFDWDVTLMPDGIYELRGFTECTEGRNYSEVATGRMDRQLPLVLGKPQPADHILSLGDDISIRFNEKIKCDSIDPELVTMQAVTLEGDTVQVSMETVCSAKTIVFNPVDPSLAELEGQTVTVFVGGIEDLAGNALDDVATWSFEVRRSEFAWAESDLLIDAGYRKPSSFFAELVNGTPVDVAFEITDLPAWLDAVPDDDSLRSGERAEIEFLVSDSLSLGTHTDTILAVVGDELTAPLFVRVDVSCQPPTWAIQPSRYQNSMVIVAQLSIDGFVSSDPLDRVAAFVGNQLRGAASLQEVPELGDYLAFLTVYSNVPAGETIRFKVYDDDECRLYEATESRYTFIADGSVGTPTDPELLNAVDMPPGSLQYVDIDRGWTWFSLNLKSQLDMTVSGLLGDLNPANGDLIKSQDQGFRQFSVNTGWVGDLTELNNRSSYMIYLSEAGTLVHEGLPVLPDTTRINIYDGWNWIGYVPQVDYAVNEALADLDPEDGDIIKSQKQFAQYVQQGGTRAWFGSLRVMQPGEGYRLFLQNANTSQNDFYYPNAPAVVATANLNGERGSGVLSKLGLVEVPAEQMKAPEPGPSWEFNPRSYQYNMTMTSVVDIAGETLTHSDGRVAAFVGDEIRGVGKLQFVPSINQFRAFLMIHSNEAEGEEIGVQVYDPRRGEVLQVDTSVDFVADRILGSIDEPVRLLAIPGDVSGSLPLTFQLARAVPNPAMGEFGAVIRYGLPRAEHVRIKLYDVKGRQVETLVDAEVPAGWYETTVSTRVLSAGVYFYRMSAGEFESVKKLVLLK